jgi:hypothetical protein
MQQLDIDGHIGIDAARQCDCLRVVSKRFSRSSDGAADLLVETLNAEAQSIEPRLEASFEISGL